MAEGTNLGAAHPVSSGGELEGEMDRKLTNDLTAQMRSLAQLRGRNADAAARMVTESASYPARDALEGGVVDLVAGDLAALISSVEGRIVAMPHKEVVISAWKRRNGRFPTHDKSLKFLSNVRFGSWIQPIDATVCRYRSAGVS